MALATFESSLARQSVIDGMTAALMPDAIPVQHVMLERELPALDHIRRLATETLPGASGVVHVTGFQYAFTTEETVTEALRLFNYNRENLVNFPVKQIWWMTPDFAATFENTVPELARYFLVSVRLTETIRPAADKTTFETLPEGSRLSPQEARQLSRINWERFDNSFLQTLTITERVRLAVEAFIPLLNGGIVTEADEMWKRVSEQMQAIGLPIESYVTADPDFVPITRQDTVNLTNLADFFSEVGQYEKAEPLYIRSLQMCNQLSSGDNPMTATITNNIAALYVSRGLYDQAESFFLQSLSIRETTLGAMDSSTAMSLSNLANLYRLRGLYDIAEPLFIRALAISKQTSGPLHPITGTNLNNLALLYCLQGLYDKAELLYIQALSISEQCLGSIHPNTATSLRNLAHVYELQNKLSNAEPLYVRALAINEQVLGGAHTHTAASLNQMAGLYESQGFYDKAEPMYVRALEIFKQVLGTMHPDTAITINDLAYLYQSQGFPDKAEPLYVEALLICEETVGAMHPDTARSLNNLGVLRAEQGRYDESEQLLHRALTIRVTALGANHPNTLETSGILSIVRIKRSMTQAMNRLKPYKFPVMSSTNHKNRRNKKTR